MSLIISGQVYEFGLDEQHIRPYTVITVPFSVARQCFKPKRYSSLTGEGEQRELFDRHVIKLKKAMITGEFTPSTATIGLTDEQQQRLIHKDIDDVKYVELFLEEEETVPLLDAGHRMAALEQIYESGNERALVQPITAIILLNGNRKLDFINLQAGRAVDRAHMLSLSIQENVADERMIGILSASLKIAKILSLESQSPFYKKIKFDSTNDGCIPISTIMSRGPSDFSTSLIGGAKIVFNKEDLLEFPEAWYADTLTKTYKIIVDNCKHLTLRGMPLCIPPEGTKGAATMIVGCANLMAYRLLRLNRFEPITNDINTFIKAANKVLNVTVSGNFAAARKRNLMGALAVWFLSDLPDEDLHEGIPISLIDILSTSTFSVPRITKSSLKAKSKKTKSKKSKKTKEKVPGKPALAQDEFDFDDIGKERVEVEFKNVSVTKEIKSTGKVLEDKTDLLIDWDSSAPWDEDFT